MTDLLLQDGDLVADRYGDISVCIDEDNDIMQMVNTNLLLRFKGNKFHKELGNKVYSKRIKATESGMEMIRAECIDAIMNSDPRVKKVKHINTTLSDDATCIIDYILLYTSTASGELIEVDGKTYINAFNMEGGE